MAEPTPEEVEAVAIAIWENDTAGAAWANERGTTKSIYRSHATAAILALDQHRKKGD